MKLGRFTTGLAIAAALMTATTMVRADVRTEEKTLVKFEGMLGRMMGAFGGKAAREGITSTVAVKGDRKLTISGDTGQLIDLKEEKVYELDMDGKSYKVVTFAEMRKKIEEARKRAAEASPEARDKPKDPQQKELEVDFDVKETGQKRAISGYDAREVLMTVTVREKGRTLQESGGMVMASTLWLAPKIAAMAELAEFDRRYAQMLYGPVLFASAADQTAMAVAMYPMLAKAMEKFQNEKVNMDGTPIQTVVKIELVASAADAARAKESEGGGGLGGMLARKMAGKSENATPGRSTFMTTTHELLKVSSDTGEVGIPAGFKQK
jgi:hypothetical protein